MRCTQVLVGDAVSAFGGAAADHAMPRARSGSAHTASEPGRPGPSTADRAGGLRRPVVARGADAGAWLDVFMEVHMRIKVYMHMAG
jgi:hypothetical protein